MHVQTKIMFSASQLPLASIGISYLKLDLSPQKPQMLETKHFLKSFRYKDEVIQKQGRDD